MDNIKAIFFDYDNTLGSRYDYAYDTYCDLLDKFYPEMIKGSVYYEAIIQDLLTFDQLGNVSANYHFQW